MRKTALFVFAFALILLGCKKEEFTNLKDGLYADIETSKGNILVKLDYEKAPVTVANFVSLAEGKNSHVKEELKGKNFFDGLVFHRVEPGFVIQGGDPDGNGSGGPGYNFDDEFSSLKHDKAGTLSMANAGAGTNGSQFFITLAATPHLDNRHSVFGYVEQGMDVVNQIAVGDEMKSIKIIRVGEAAKKFDATKVFDKYFIDKENNIKKIKDTWAKEEPEFKNALSKTVSNKLALFAKLKASGTKLPSGVVYNIVSKSNEKTPAGTLVAINYSGFLEDGTLFDTSDANVAKQFLKYIVERDLVKDYKPLNFQLGNKGQFVPGFEEAINKMNAGEKAVIFIPANMGYGENGAGNVIPPNANLIFEVEILK